MNDSKIPDEDWKSKLTPEQYRICRKKGTERPFSGKYWDNYKDGIYECVCCGQSLFTSKHKFDSGTGWPSFYEVIDTSHISLKEDKSLFRSRVEVLCSKCEAHLGHVFDDGPNPTGKRYCINSEALNFICKND